MNDFSVLGFYEQTGHSFLMHTQAATPMGAFQAVAAQMLNDSNAVFVAALPGHLFEDSNIFFPGEGIVSADTVAAQPDIFPHAQEAQCQA